MFSVALQSQGALTINQPDSTLGPKHAHIIKFVIIWVILQRIFFNILVAGALLI